MKKEGEGAEDDEESGPDSPLKDGGPGLGGLDIVGGADASEALEEMNQKIEEQEKKMKEMIEKM
jgi:hypothetical protein